MCTYIKMVYFHYSLKPHFWIWVTVVTIRIYNLYLHYSGKSVKTAANQGIFKCNQKAHANQCSQSLPVKVVAVVSQYVVFASQFYLFVFKNPWLLENTCFSKIYHPTSTNFHSLNHRINSIFRDVCRLLFLLTSKQHVNCEYFPAMADAAPKKPKAEKKAAKAPAAEDKPALKKRPLKRHGRLYAKAIFTG